MAKLLFNSVVSTKDAKFMTADISNFYLNTPLTRPKYIRLSLKDIPEEIIREYNLRNLAPDNGSIYIEGRTPRKQAVGKASEQARVPPK